jgi:hypothetical protein
MLATVLGGSRTTTLTFVSGLGNGNVSLKISGGGLQYNSGNGANIADGSFDLLYNGTNGLPADLSSFGEIDIDVKSQTNPVSATVLTVTLSSGGMTFSQTQSLAGQSNGATLMYPFSGFSPSLTPSDLMNITSIEFFVDPAAGTNLVLNTSGFVVTGTPSTATGTSTSTSTSTASSTSTSTSTGTDTGGGGVGVPEPMSLALWGTLGTLLALFGRRRRASADSGQPAATRPT